MMKDLILAVDIGTTNVKCVLARRDMTVLSEATSEYKTHSYGIACFEQDHQDWWKHTVIVIRKALGKAGAPGSDVAAIAVSSQAPTMLPVKKDGTSTHPALIWMDRRCDEQCALMEERMGEGRVYQITGNSSDPFYTFGKLLWFKEHYPREFENTHSILQCNGYINYCLTGEMTIDRAHACLSQCYDVHKGDWSDEILSAFGVDRAIMPRILDCDQVIGTVHATAARETGLSEGALVLGGTVDSAAAVLEGGLTQDGLGIEMSGTSSVLLVGSEAIHTSPNLTYMCSAVPNQHLLLGCMSCTGGALKWYRDNIYSDRSADCYNAMNREILRDCPNPASVVFLPYLSGERAPIWDTHAKGAFVGLKVGTTQGEMLRAMQEGAAFALMDNMREVMAAGAKIDTLRAVGGSTNSDVWMRIKASVTNRPIEIPKTSLGAPGGLLAMLATRVGEFSSIPEACNALVKIDRVVEPVTAWVEWYKEQFAAFRQYYQQLKAGFAHADAMRQKYNFDGATE